VDAEERAEERTEVTVEDVVDDVVGDVVGDVADPTSAGPVASLSPSRASDFMTCPLLYRFRTVDRLPEPFSPAAVRGTLVHKVLEDLFDHPPAERTPDRAVDMLGPAWESLLDDEPELAEMFAEAGTDLQDWLASCDQLVHSYFAIEDPTRFEPTERELYVETTTDAGLTLRGYIDRLDVAPTGEIRIVDYKTGRSPHQAFESKALFQMKFYALVIWRTRGVIPTLLQLLYLGNQEVLRYSPTADDLLATERKVTALWAAIERAASTGDWRPSPSKLCDWCAHQALCPAFGGTPPPLPTPAASAG
jgi:putative RecB family exonuclease